MQVVATSLQPWLLVQGNTMCWVGHDNAVQWRSLTTAETIDVYDFELSRSRMLPYYPCYPNKTSRCLRNRGQRWCSSRARATSFRVSEVFCRIENCVAESPSLYPFPLRHCDMWRVYVLGSSQSRAFRTADHQIYPSSSSRRNAQFGCMVSSAIAREFGKNRVRCMEGG